MRSALLSPGDVTPRVGMRVREAQEAYFDAGSPSYEPESSPSERRYDNVRIMMPDGTEIVHDCDDDEIMAIAPKLTETGRQLCGERRVVLASRARPHIR